MGLITIISASPGYIKNDRTTSVTSLNVELSFLIKVYSIS